MLSAIANVGIWPRMVAGNASGFHLVATLEILPKNNPPDTVEIMIVMFDCQTCTGNKPVLKTNGVGYLMGDRIV